ncbi:MAG: RNA polymerase sigma factor [Albidovulum sp.]
MTLSPSPKDSAAELVALIPELNRLSRRLSRDPAAADDLVQDALLRVWAKLRSGTDVETLKPYLLTAARNLARRPYQRPLSLEDAPEPEAVSDMPGRMALRDVASVLSRLPEAEVRLLLRHAARGETYAEIAKSEGLPIGTVMSRLARTRAKIRIDCNLPAAGPVTRLLTGEDAA